MLRSRVRLVLVALALLLPPNRGFAQLRAEFVVNGLSAPVAFVQHPVDPAVQFVVEQGGRVRVLRNRVLQAHDFLSISVASSGEQGLLGLAFAPDHATSGRVFVYFNNPSGHIVVARFVRSGSDPLQADPTTRKDFVWPGGLPYLPKSFGNHNGGHLAFGPDGYLYIGVGDGGSSNDPSHLAQHPLSLFGKMLRLDTSVPDSDPEGYDVPAGNPFAATSGVFGEIWAFGVRNPWRWSFDDPAFGGTGGLIMGDVGQGQWEEVNYEPAGVGGRNYGWRNREGSHDHVTSLPPFATPLTDPVFEYSHAEGRSITGGVIYRGTALGAGYRGRYFFGDFAANRVWSLALNAGFDPAIASDLQDHTASLVAGASSPSAFGVDAAGELYVLNYVDGAIHQVVLDEAASCPGADPFAILGGGTCADGNWLPPGITPPGTPAPIPPTPPTPTPAPPTAAPSTCPGPDPFAILGGGTCANGDWYPPGITPPGAPSVPVPPTPPTLPVPAPPTPSPGGCPGADPFAILGGGTCVGGNWYPPGLTPPGTPTPPVAPPTSGCPGLDPFVILGGGRCIGGNWYPPDGTLAVEAAMSATRHRLSPVRHIVQSI